ncbi:hypothetical protein Adt_21233 [Abeliophyllum distichum]|uniref:Uncharacterized protein n=1 Tax=Abeliophyllum distichum TaxID=126358 RepID=A0ABD1SYW3_9LAMI
MSSGNDDSLNQSDTRTNPSIQGESPSSASSSSSSEVMEEVNQAPSAARLLTSSASGSGLAQLHLRKRLHRKGGPNVEVPEMRGSLNKWDAPVAKVLDEELKRLATKFSIARSRITEGGWRT